LGFHIWHTPTMRVAALLRSEPIEIEWLSIVGAERGKRLRRGVPIRHPLAVGEGSGKNGHSR
jgi:hypothetical protein